MPRVHVGEYKLSVASMSYRRFEPIPLTVRPAEITIVEARLRPENRVEDCLAMPACASVLDRTPLSGMLADGAVLMEAALRTSVAIVVSEGWRLGEFAVCIPESNTRIRENLARDILRVVPAGECELRPEGPPGGHPRVGSRLIHLPTGGKAVSFDAKIISQSDDRATAQLTNYVGPLWGEGWHCEFKRDAGIWKATSCRMTWIS
jgi:hypothetical protein